jgi:hypothetical protein
MIIIKNFDFFDFLFIFKTNFDIRQRFVVFDTSEPHIIIIIGVVIIIKNIFEDSFVAFIIINSSQIFGHGADGDGAFDVDEVVVEVVELEAGQTYIFSVAEVLAQDELDLEKRDEVDVVGGEVEGDVKGGVSSDGRAQEIVEVLVVGRGVVGVGDVGGVVVVVVVVEVLVELHRGVVVFFRPVGVDLVFREVFELDRGLEVVVFEVVFLG